jgi:hypothetical protein
VSGGLGRTDLVFRLTMEMMNILGAIIALPPGVARTGQQLVPMVIPAASRDSSRRMLDILDQLP